MAQLVVANLTITSPAQTVEVQTPGTVKIVTVGTTGYSGFSGKSGYSGFSGKSGYSGFSGANPGASGYSGYSGISGFSGRSGYSGYSGAGTSGYSGFSGKSGYSGYSGISGYSGFTGVSGFSGVTKTIFGLVGVFTRTAGSTSYFGNYGISATETVVQVPIPCACTIKTLYVATNTAQPGDNALALTVRKNAADTAIVTTVTAGAAAGVFSGTGSVAFAAGDLITIKIVNSSSSTSAAICGASLEIWT